MLCQYFLISKNRRRLSEASRQTPGFTQPCSLAEHVTSGGVHCAVVVEGNNFNAAYKTKVYRADMLSTLSEDKWAIIGNHRTAIIIDYVTV